jgi:uncharacterized protein (DUF885 family)
VPSAHPVFDLADRLTDDLAAAMPIVATYAGVAGHDERWGDLGPEGLEAVEALLRRTRDELGELPTTDGDDDATLAVRVLEEEVDQLLDASAHGEDLLDVSHTSWTVRALADVLSAQEVGTPEAGEAMLARLRTLPDALASWRRRIDLALDRDLVVARRQVESAVRQLDALARPDGALGSAAQRLAAEHPDLADVANATVPTMSAAASETAAYLRERYLPRAPERDAVGRDRYLREARRHLGAELDPEEATAWAWDELARLWERAGEVAARIDDTRDLDGVLQLLATDPTYAAPDPETFRQLMEERQVTALEQLSGTHFDVPDAIRNVTVQLAPPGGPLGAYYMGPSEDLSRPGSIWWSLGDRQVIPLFDQVSTAYHEGFPGHHLQVGIQVLLGDRLSRAHRLLIWNPGYGEGWALYTERLADELGMLETPAYELGYLTSQLLRVVRVLVDIGLHLELTIPDDAPFHPGEPWTYELAVDALEHHARLPREECLSEVTRYLGWPGQAISYALGQRTILELREERRRREGDAFDLRAFHADVLGSGPVGLDHLRELVLR